MSDPILHLAISAESCVFVKQSRSPFHCGSSCEEHPFFRSYGVILPSSLTWSHSRALGFSPHLPVSVYGTVRSRTTCEGFLGSVVRRLPSGFPEVRIGFQVDAPPDLPGRAPLRPCPATTITRDRLPFCVTPQVNAHDLVPEY